MYKTLKAEMNKKGITGYEVAELLDVRRETVYNKINGRIAIGFTIDEALKIKNKYFPDMTYEYLFQKEAK